MITEDCNELIISHEQFYYPNTFGSTINHISYANYRSHHSNLISIPALQNYHSSHEYLQQPKHCGYFLIYSQLFVLFPYSSKFSPSFHTNSSSKHFLQMFPIGFVTQIFFFFRHQSHFMIKLYKSHHLPSTIVIISFNYPNFFRQFFVLPRTECNTLRFQSLLIVVHNRPHSGQCVIIALIIQAVS